jgi:predicted transcriptional regulator
MVERKKIEHKTWNKNEWATLEDSHLIEIILNAIGDEDKKNIINAVINKSCKISEILEINNIPQTSGYRKIKTLIDDGILIPQVCVRTHDGKEVAKYRAIFDNVDISLEKNKIVVKVHHADLNLANI